MSLYICFTVTFQTFSIQTESANKLFTDIFSPLKMYKAPDDEAEYLTASRAGRSFWRATLIRGGVSDGGSSAKERKLSGNSLFNLLDFVFEAVAAFKI